MPDVDTYRDFVFYIEARKDPGIPEAPIPWREEYEAINLENFQFRHPMIVIDSTDAEFVRQRISAHVEPQRKGYNNLLSDAENALGFTPDPPATMNIMGGYEPNSNLNEMRAWLWRNCHAAYSSALAYFYSGQMKYADKSIEVLNAWADKNTTFTGGDRGLQLGSFFQPMLYAADLLFNYDGWHPSDKEKFLNWWRNKVLVHTLDVLRKKDNNWKDAGLLGSMSAAVVLEDTSLMRECLIQLKSYFFRRYDDHVRLPGDWKIMKDGKGTYLPRQLVRNDGARGLTCTAYGLATSNQAMEIAGLAGL